MPHAPNNTNRQFASLAGEKKAQPKKLCLADGVSTDVV